MRTKILSFVLSITLASTITIPATAQTKDSKPNQTKVTKKLEDNDNPDMIGKRDINKHQIDFCSIEKEINIGRQYAQQIDQQLQFVTDPDINEYVNRLGQNIVLNSDAKVPFTIRIIDSMEVNAFALPGGFFYVNKGLLMDVTTESELVGVMAHEIAHVACRHAVEQQAKGTLVRFATIPMILTGAGGILMQQVANILLPLTFLKFSRKAEAEADKYAVQYAYKSGYDPKALNDIIARLDQQKKGGSGGFAGVFSDHPANADRMKKISEMAVKLPEKDEYIVSSSDFDKMKKKLNAIVGQRKQLDPNNPDPVDPGRPTLKRRSGDPQVDPLPWPGDDANKSDDSEKKPPTLKRRQDSPVDPPTPDKEDDQDPDKKPD